jgi:hypothetical protein
MPEPVGADILIAPVGEPHKGWTTDIVGAEGPGLRAIVTSVPAEMHPVGLFALTE